MTDVARTSNLVLDELTVIHFLGWLSVDIPELHRVEAYRLMEAWDRYKVKVWMEEHDLRVQQDETTEKHIGEE